MRSKPGTQLLAATASTAIFADTATYATNAGHADTAALALSGNSGWKDLGSIITLKTFGDSVAIGTENPGALFEADGSEKEIIDIVSPGR